MSVLRYRRAPFYVGADLGALDPRVREIAQAGHQPQLVVQWPFEDQGRPVVCTPQKSGVAIRSRPNDTGHHAIGRVYSDLGYNQNGDYFFMAGITLDTTSECGMIAQVGGFIGGAAGLGIGVGATGDGSTPGNKFLALQDGVAWLGTTSIGTGFHTLAYDYSNNYGDTNYWWIDGANVEGGGTASAIGPGGVSSYGAKFDLSLSGTKGIHLHWMIAGFEPPAATRHDVQVALALNLFPPGRPPLLRFPRRRRTFIFAQPAAGGAVTGTLAVTEGADVFAATGLETFTGTLAATEGADTCSMTGIAAFGVAGTLAATEGTDSASASGTVGTAPITGTLVATEGADNASAIGLVAIPVTGTLAATEGADRCTMTGIGGISAQGLAQLYGGGLFAEEKGEEKKRKKKPSLEIMVRAVAAEPEGKKAVIKALPPKVQQAFPDPQIVIVSELVKRIEAASQPVKQEIERLYKKREEDEEDDLFILLL